MSTAVVLPGRTFGHGIEQAGLYLVEVALELAGAELARVDWPAEGMPEGRDEAVAAVARIARPWLDQGPDYVVAKSLGTLAAPLAAERGIAGIWLTPLLDEPVCRDAILANPARQLLIGGDADFSWEPAAAAAAEEAGATVAVLPGVNHGLFVDGDPVATAQSLARLVRAVADFVRA